ncbi:MAG TPA: hypothetical protein VH498_03845 [Candidatus Dormibacteraeota bacterium]|jgi:hypothetical protein|nr:hypothetical protein [Candidatus Dormibacteraeota bacterium]
MALHVSPSVESLEDTREQIIELVGTRSDPVQAPGDVADTPAILALQLLAIDNFVEIIRLRTDVAERDRRIATLTVGLRTWRERSGIEQASRRRDLAEAREREREVISLLHQQMQVADSATAELERIRSRSWWRRLLG